MISEIHDPMALARRKPWRAGMASSYDRRGGNHDWSNYVRVEGAEAVLADLEGPGVVTRIWSADPRTSLVRVYIDGAREPSLQCALPELFDRLPLSFGIGGERPENYERSRVERKPMGRTSYCPIAYARSCKITVEPEDDYLYYHVNYRSLPADAHVESSDPGAAGAGLTADAERALDAWERQETLTPWSGATTSALHLASGGASELFRASGPGVVRSFRIELPWIEDPARRAHVRDSLWLTVHCDDDEPRDPSVRAPVGPLFLDFGQEPAPRSLYVGTDADGAYFSCFAMPHRDRLRIGLENRSVLDVGPITVTVLHEPLPAFPSDLFRFRATWHQETPFGPDHRDYGGACVRILNLDGRDNYEMLNARAAGHFAGCGFHIDLRDAPTDRAAGEGDEMFFIDDDPRLTLYGTGTEDYVNDAWGIRGYVGPLSGDGLAGAWGVDPQIYGYRLHLSDAVPFVRKGRFTLEHGTGNNCSGSYRSIAYWYMDPASARTRAEERIWEELRDGKRVARP